MRKTSDTNHEENPEFLDIRGVAKLLSTSTRNVAKLKAQGILPYVKLSQRFVRYPRQGVLEALNRLTIGRL